MGKKISKAKSEKNEVDYSKMPVLDALRKAFENCGDGKVFAVTSPLSSEQSIYKFEVARQLVVSAPDKLVEFRVKVAVLCLQAFGRAGGMDYSTQVQFLCFVGGKYRDLAIDCQSSVPDYGTEARQKFMETAPEAVFVASEKVRHALAKKRPPMPPESNVDIDYD